MLMGRLAWNFRVTSDRVAGGGSSSLFLAVSPPFIIPSLSLFFFFSFVLSKEAEFYIDVTIVSPQGCSGTLNNCDPSD